MLHALGLAGVAFDLDARARRGEHIEARGGANLVDAEQMGGVADNDNAAQIVGACDDGEAPDGLVGAGAFGFGNDVGLGNTCANQVILPDLALGELVAAIPAQGYDERCDPTAVKRLGVVEAGAKDRRGMAIVLGGTENGDGIGRSGKVLACVPLNPGRKPSGTR